jgi:hypothetical protein
MPMVASNCALVAPHFRATAKPCTISPASAPTMCRPSTRSVVASTISLTRVRSLPPLNVCLSGEVAAEHPDGAVPLARLLLAQAHGADGRVGEDGGGDAAVVHDARGLAGRGPNG